MTSAGRDFSGSTIGYLVNFLLRRGGDDLVAAVLDRAGETRPVAELVADESWSSYAQVRALWEATGDVIGGAGGLRDVGAGVWDTVSTPGFTDALQSLGGPEGLLGVLEHVAARIAPAVAHRTEEVEPGEWLVDVRFSGDGQPFAEYCNYSVGLLSQIPTVYGLPPAEVDEEECQLQGAHACRFRVRWVPVPAEEEPSAEFLATRVRILEQRLVSLHETVSDLVSGESLEVVLGRVIEAAARAVVAQGFVLVLDELPYADRRVYSSGLTEEQAADAAASLLDPSPEPDARWLVVDVASTRRRYGHLGAAHSGEFLPHDRMLLDAYARLAAAALDSAATLEEARRQAATSDALLELARALADIGTTQEMAHRLAQAVPAVVDCDRATVALREEPDGDTAHVVAAYGFGSTEQLANLQGWKIRVDESDLYFGQLQLVVAGDDLHRSGVAQLGDAAAMATVPIEARGTVVGWVTAIVDREPARLTSDPHVPERLRGLAGQAATAMRNAQLVDEIRHQALHDPLTGLANQRLLEEHANTELVRARRASERVGLLFLDLDRFKHVNDTYGHTGGDELLQAVAHRLTSVLRASDTAGRFGGDEFVVLLPDLRGDGSAVLDKVAEAFREPFVVQGTPIAAGASLGLAVAPDDGDTYAALLSCADKRMYEAKSRRRDTAGS